MSSFKALMVHRDEDKTIRHEMTKLQHCDLPADGEVLVAVKYSTVNYKDGLCLSARAGWCETIRIFRALILLVR